MLKCIYFKDSQNRPISAAVELHHATGYVVILSAFIETKSPVVFLTTLEKEKIQMDFQPQMMNLYKKTKGFHNETKDIRP